MINIFQKITTDLVNKGKRIIGINGVDCAGKTTFATNYSEYLTSVGIKNVIIHIDDYHHTREVRDRGDYYDTALNYQLLIDEILDPLKKIGYIDKEIVCLDVDTDRFENIRHYMIDRDTVVLLEGFLLFRPPLSEYLDGKIYIHIDFDETLRRTAVRDVPKYGEWFIGLTKDLFIPTQKRYINEFEPHKNCDIFIDNSDYENPILSAIG
jgi:phosphoglycolate phosphatase